MRLATLKQTIEKRYSGALVAGIDPDWKPWEAGDNHPQRMALESHASRIGFGGAAGGGKSALIMMLAYYKHLFSLIMRRITPNLQDLEEKSRRMFFGSGATYNSQVKIWRNVPPGDRLIKLGHCQYENDKEKHRGIEHDLKAFDEVTEFSRSQVEFICGWTRSPVFGQHCQVLFTFNPPTSQQGRWIRNYFAPWIDSKYSEKTGRPRAAPGELRWFITISDDGENYEDVEILEENLEFYIMTRDEEEVMVENSDPVLYIETGSSWAIFPYEKEREKEGIKLVPRAKEITHKGKEYEPHSRTFIPALLGDNPHLRNTNYKSILQSFPEPMRSALLYGDFSVDIEKDHAFQIIPREWVKAAMARWTERGYIAEVQRRIACDPSWGGVDNCVIASLYGNWCSRLTVMGKDEIRKSDGTIAGEIIADKIIELKRLDGVELVVDVGGIGASPYDFLRKKKQRPIPFFSSAAAKDGNDNRLTDATGNLVFVNYRAYAHWYMRDLLDPDGDTVIALPPDDDLLEELCCPRWESPQKVGDKMEIKVESKDIIKGGDRLGRSPDRADTVMMLFVPMHNIPIWVRLANQHRLDKM